MLGRHGCNCKKESSEPDFNAARWQMRRKVSSEKSSSSRSSSSGINIKSPANYEVVEQLFDRPINVCIEGNIGAGKSTFIIRLVTKGEILTLREPLDHWRDVNNVNLLDLAYRDPSNWAFEFQSYVFATMMKSHLHPGRTKIMERSIESAYHVFQRAYQKSNGINPTQAKFLNEWYALLMTHLPVKVDLIIYLRVSPEKALERMRKRNRFERALCYNRFFAYVG